MRRYKSAPSIVLFLNVLRLPDGRIPKLAILLGNRQVWNGITGLANVL
jgi:hypothetical protein